MQETFMMIKPDGIQHKEAVLQRLKDEGLIIKPYKEIKTDIQIMQTLLDHYHEVIDRMGKDFNYVGKLFNSFYFGDFSLIPLHVTYDGEEDIIEKTRTLAGATNPQDAKENTLRNLYSDDNYEKADRDERLVNNVIHASDSHESAQRELNIWKNYL